MAVPQKANKCAVLSDTRKYQYVAGTLWPFRRLFHKNRPPCVGRTVAAAPILFVEDEELGSRLIKPTWCDHPPGQLPVRQPLGQEIVGMRGNQLAGQVGQSIAGEA